MRIHKIVSDLHLNKLLRPHLHGKANRTSSLPDGTPGAYCMHIRRLLRTTSKQCVTVDALDHHRIFVKYVAFAAYRTLTIS